MVTTTVLPALVLFLIALKVLSARENHRNVSLLWGFVTLIPAIFLIYGVESVAIWSFANFNSGNGSARAAYGVIFTILATLMAIYGLAMAIWVFPKTKFYEVVLISLALCIVIPTISYDAYDYYQQYQRGWVGGVSKSKVIEAADNSIDFGIGRKLVRAQREQDTWNVEFDLLDDQSNYIARKMIFVDARSGEVDHSNETRMRLDINRSGIPVKNARISIGTLGERKTMIPTSMLLISLIAF